MILLIFLNSASNCLGQMAIGKAKDYSLVLSIWVLRLTLLGMIVLSYKSPWEELIAFDWSNHLGTLAPLVIAFLLASLAPPKSNNKFVLVLSQYGLFLAVILAIMLADKSHAVYFQVFDNVLLAGFGIWLILFGNNRGISHYLYLGVSTLSLIAILRYFDLIGGYIGGAILFAVIAIILLMTARFWNKRVTL